MMEVEKLINEVKKHKKMFENYALNPFAYEINENKYYFVTYKRKEKETGYAVISLDSPLKDEYMEALQKLLLFSGVSRNIFIEIGPRASVGPEFFTNIINAVEDYLKQGGDKENKILIEGLNLFVKMRETQIKTIQLYKEYENYYDNGVLKRNIITDNDIDYTLTMVHQFDMLLFTLNYLSNNHIDALERFKNEIFSKNIDRTIDKESKKFLQGLLAEKENIAKGSQNFIFEEKIKDLPLEEQLTKKKIEVQKSAAEFQEKVMKNLRHPLNI